MKRLTAILVPLVAFASPAVAANTPEVLVQELAQLITATKEAFSPI
jgi:hypothetical protein